MKDKTDYRCVGFDGLSKCDIKDRCYRHVMQARNPSIFCGRYYGSLYFALGGENVCRHFVDYEITIKSNVKRFLNLCE